MDSSLVIRAGPGALRLLRRDGFDRDDVSLLVGASGGPKWLALARMDRVLARRIVRDRQRPLAVLGSSIGTFRHACFAQHDPEAALDRFEDAYVAQTYERRPTAAEVTQESRRIIEIMFGETGRKELLEHPRVHTHAVAARGRGWLAHEDRVRLGLGLGAAAFANAVSRRTLAAFFERTVFHTGTSGITWHHLPTATAALTRRNIDDALLASGSIPLVMSGMRAIADAPTGTYRDGGIVDYHFSFDFTAADGLVLFPHFFDRITPGWFDKSLPWRRPASANLDRVLFIAPSPAFVAALPGAAVPDRGDFARMPTDERQTRWRRVLAETERLADELDQLIDDQRLADVAQSFD